MGTDIAPSPTHAKLASLESCAAVCAGNAPVNGAGAIILAYGTERVLTRLARKGLADRADDLSRPGAPAVRLQPASGRPLRMSEVAHPFALPPKAQDLSHAETQLACLQGHVRQLGGLWNKPLAEFTDHYFDALRHVVAVDADDLVRRAGALAGLVEPMHWCFAAPMPLPRAHLGIDSKGAIDGSNAARTIMVDLLFQDRDGLIAVEAGRRTRTPGRQKDLALLKAAGVRLFSPKRGAAGETLLAALGPDFRDFAKSVDLPQSPFRGQGVPLPIS